MTTGQWDSGEPGVLVVAAAIVDDLEHPTRLLAARRTEPPHLAGGWELPGGKVEPGEDPVDALHRELAEELGTAVRLGQEVRRPGGGAWPLPPSATFRLWTAVVVDGEPMPLEDHDALRWLRPGEWGDVGWLDADVPAVAELARRAEPHVVAVLPDRDAADEVASLVEASGAVPHVRREALAGEDDAEDAQWLVGVSGLLAAAQVEAWAAERDGWTEAP